jgi:hypothetical protein
MIQWERIYWLPLLFFVRLFFGICAQAPPMLTSLQNPLVKQIRKLHRSKERREQHLCLLEGSHLLEAACDVCLPLQVVCCTADWAAQYAPLYDRAVELSQRVELVSPDVLRSMATTVEPDGVLAIAPRQHQKPIDLPHIGIGQSQSIASLSGPMVSAPDGDRPRLAT